MAVGDALFSSGIAEVHGSNITKAKRLQKLSNLDFH
jgi:hypothetical protein